ncbi:MAG: sulfite exporter TauE/SafE family protein [Planctomycetaceae bacterium]|nr:sulfite exporter TauE/SafE family protein [Planctomycetaceae bacterium]
MSAQKFTLVSFWKLRPFILWLGIFYSCWLMLILLGGYGETLKTHWPIALSMAFGSYFAGSTPMGGGTVGFPVLVLLFEYPGAMGRTFGLAIQSIGMVSASIFIFSAGYPVQWRLLRPALLGTLIGTPLGATFIAPVLPDIWVKLLFAIVWASFGVMHLVKLKELVNSHELDVSYGNLDRVIGFSVGMSGGIVASLTGVGIDMMLYATLVLLYRADLKMAIPTSVIIMAFTSLVGIASNVLLSRINPAVYGISPAVFPNWLAAAPVVAIGAPFGALIVNLISRTPTILVVSLLCIGQFAWTLMQEKVSGGLLICAFAGVGIMNLAFMVLHRFGHSSTLAKRNVPTNPIAYAPVSNTEIALHTPSE